jgi:hypothetical protein
MLTQNTLAIPIDIVTTTVLAVVLVACTPLVVRYNCDNIQVYKYCYNFQVYRLFITCSLQKHIWWDSKVEYTAAVTPNRVTPYRATPDTGMLQKYDVRAVSTARICSY